MRADELIVRWRQTDESGPDRSVLHRIDVRAELLIAAPRGVVWQALTLHTDDDEGWSHVDGTPERGVGARRVHLAPPLPPHGLRTVMLSELTAWSEGHWITSQTWATAWHHTETTTLREMPGDATLAALAGWWTRMSPPGATFDHMRAPLTKLADEFLARIAGRAAEIGDQAA